MVIVPTQRLVVKFDEFLIRIGALNSWIFIAALAAVPVINSFAVDWLVRHNAVNAFAPNAVFAATVPMSAKLVLALLAAPLIETFLFKVALYLLRRLLKLNTLVSILICAFAFALEHPHSVAYAYASFTIGICFASVYVAKSYEGQHPFLVVAAGHALGNAFVLYNVYGMGIFGR